MTNYVTLEQILAYHSELMLLQGQQSLLMGDQGRDKLEAALGRPQASAFGEDAYHTLAEKAGALLQAVAIAHPFSDGNKRAATAAMLAFLEMNGESLDVDQDRLYELVIDVTEGEIREVSELASRLRELFPGLA